MSINRSEQALSDVDFVFMRDFIYSKSAIVLENDKRYLIEARLAPLVRVHGMASLTALVQELRKQANPELQAQAVDAITTNETSFFRDRHPFEALRRTVLPELIDKRARQRYLRIWSAACSSGQEPYSIAMLLSEHFPALADWCVEILATDLSGNMIQRAQSGCYNQFEINRGLPAHLLIRNFEKAGAEWQIKKNIRDKVNFRQINLASDWPHMEPWDVILIRNVLIYFNLDTKRSIFTKLRRALRPDGYLFLGTAETAHNVDADFQRTPRANTGCYQLLNANETKAAAVSD